MFVGCKKDASVDVLTLRTENYVSQEKTHIVSANDVYYTVWDNGDEIMVNGSVCTLSDGSDNVTVEHSDKYYAIYPASCVSSASVTCSTTNITLPEVQIYRENSDGKQILSAPMAAQSVSNGNGNILFFKNLCTLVNVHVTGNVKVHNINVHSNGTPLSGTATVDISNPTNPTLGTVTGKNHVSLYFPNSYQTPSAGKDFFIAVPSVSEGETLHVTLAATLVNGDVKKIYLRSAPVLQNLPANMIIPLNIFPSVGNYSVAQCLVYLAGNRQSVGGTGYQRPYVNTGINPTETTIITMSLATSPTIASGDLPTGAQSQFLYGVNGYNYENCLFYMWKYTSGRTTDLVQTGRNRVEPEGLSSTPSDTRILLTHTPTSIILKTMTSGATVKTDFSAPSHYEGSNPIYLMGAYGSTNHFLGKCHYFRIEDASGLRFYGIPVKISVADWNNKIVARGLDHGNGATNGYVPCFYDMVSGEFFSSEENGVHFKYGESSSSDDFYDYSTDSSPSK